VATKPAQQPAHHAAATVQQHAASVATAAAPVAETVAQVAAPVVAVVVPAATASRPAATQASHRATQAKARTARPAKPAKRTHHRPIRRAEASHTAETTASSVAAQSGPAVVQGLDAPTAQFAGIPHAVPAPKAPAADGTRRAAAATRSQLPAPLPSRAPAPSRPSGLTGAGTGSSSAGGAALLLLALLGASAPILPPSLRGRLRTRSIGPRLLLFPLLLERPG
jgi:hypothetical protein